jgi:hypothetical protein
MIVLVGVSERTTGGKRGKEHVKRMNDIETQ